LHTGGEKEIETKKRSFGNDAPALFRADADSYLEAPELFQLIFVPYKDIWHVAILIPTLTSWLKKIPKGTKQTQHHFRREWCWDLTENPAKSARHSATGSPRHRVTLSLTETTKVELVIFTDRH